MQLYFSEAINELKSNFLFLISLGSKELFHSNMIAWILEQQNKVCEYEVLRLFIKEVAKLEVGIITDDNKPIIGREENKIDLTIKWKEGDNWNLIFIENKMKSIPTPKQLNEYDYKIDVFWDTKTKSWPPNKRVRKKFILTPFPSRVQSNSKIMPWENITYSKEIINDFLPKIKELEFINSEKTYIKIVLEKYLSLLKIQNDILKYFKLDDSEEFKKRYYDFYLDNSINELRKIRIHDLVLKLAHSKIEECLRDTLDPKFTIARYETAFTDSKGLSTVEVQIRENYFIGIQIQGNQFRYFTRTDDSLKVKINEKFAVELFNKQLWFYDLDTLESLKGKGRDKSKKYKNYGLKDQTGDRSFCEYFNGAFVYLYKELNQPNRPFTINDVIDLVVRSFEHYKAKETEFKQILKDLD